MQANLSINEIMYGLLHSKLMQDTIMAMHLYDMDAYQLAQLNAISLVLLDNSLAIPH